MWIILLAGIYEQVTPQGAYASGSVILIVDSTIEIPLSGKRCRRGVFLWLDRGG